MTIGITGSTGFLGLAVLRTLAVPDESRLRCLVRHGAPRNARARIDWVPGDLMNEADCEEFVDGLDVVVHLAQSNSPATSDRHWPSDFAANVTPSLNLFEALRRRGGDPCHLIFASSGGAVYGRPEASQRALRETDECFPLSPYGIQKLALEHYLRTACDQGWLRATVLRISNAYGSLLSAERRQGLIGVAMARLLAGQPVRIFGPLATVRDYIHVDDVARAFDSVLASGYDSSAENNFRIFNIGSGTGHSVAEVLALLGKVTGCDVLTENSGFGAATISSVPAIVLDISKASRELGWEPRVSFHDGIAAMYVAESSEARLLVRPEGSLR
jgi:UDP-glucose 4-epimerase